MNEYPGLTVYWKRELWEQNIAGDTAIEDFELDGPDYGEISFPFLTGNGFLLTGESSAQILRDGLLLESGTLLHFRDWGPGLTFTFPNDTAVSAFGFDYKPSETWQLTVNDSIITIPRGRKGFVGVVIHENFPKWFVLSSTAYAQGGLTVDNIIYVAVNAP